VGLCSRFLSPWRVCCNSCAGEGFGVDEYASSEGYVTPRSLETPVAASGKCPSLNQIRDPYAPASGASRHAPLRVTRSIEQQQLLRSGTGGSGGTSSSSASGTATRQPQSTARTTPEDEDSIYTILIRFPPASKHEHHCSGKNGHPVQEHRHHRHNHHHHHHHHRQHHQHHGNGLCRRVPSIQMLPGDSSTDLRAILEGSGGRCYPRTLPIGSRRFDSARTASERSGSAAARDAAKRNSCHLTGGGGRPASSTTTTAAASSSGVGASGSLRGAKEDDITRLPLDTRLVPKQLVRGASAATPTSSSVAAIATPTSTLGMGGGGLRIHQGGYSAAGAIVAPFGGLARKKASSEKKQDRKAAKTLSAILLAFIVTWAPYSVLVVINAVLGKEAADDYIPNLLWTFSYSLCYINSTVSSCRDE